MRAGPDAVAAAVDEAVATERLRIVATLIRVTGEWELAEDCVQDAVESALTRWPRDGIPDNPAAWLTTTSRRRALDVLKRRRIEQHKLRELEALSEGAAAAPPSGDGPLDDDRLRLLFACCHPALPIAGRVALTLRTVAGLTTQQIARAFLVSEATMGQRLLRTRTKIANAGISLRVPEPHRLAERTAGVLAVIYLVFNEGYSPTDDGGFRDDLAEEALYLADLVRTASRRRRGPGAPGAAPAPARPPRRTGRLGRRAPHARGAGSGALGSRPDRRGAREPRRRSGDRTTSARIPAPGGDRRAPRDRCRCREHRLAAHRRGLRRLAGAAPLPFVALNRAVAVAMADGPDAGLEALAELDAAALGEYPLLPAVEANFLRRAGRRREAADAYLDAIAEARPEPERRLLRRRLAEVSAPQVSD